MSETNSASMPRSITGQQGSRKSWPYRARAASTSILKTLPARSGRRFCRCSIASRGCHCVASLQRRHRCRAESTTSYDAGGLASKPAATLLRGYINTEFVDEHYDSFLREIGPRVRSGEILYANTSSTASRRRRRPLSAFWPAGTLVKRSFAFRDACAGFRRRRCRREGRVTSWRKNPALAVSHSHRTKSA